MAGGKQFSIGRKPAFVLFVLCPLACAYQTVPEAECKIEIPSHPLDAETHSDIASLTDVFTPPSTLPPCPVRSSSVPKHHCNGNGGGRGGGCRGGEVGGGEGGRGGG